MAIESGSASSRSSRGPRRTSHEVGFQVEGVGRESVLVDRAFADAVLMGLLRPDFEAVGAADGIAQAGS